jgi:adenylate cyclase
MNQRFIRIALGLCVTLPFMLHLLHMPRLGVLDQMDQSIADIRMRLDNEFRSFKSDPVKKAVVDSIVILDIDEQSLASLGRWPWSRDKLANIMDLLFDKYQIGVLGFDVVFAEPDTSSGLNTLKALERGPLKDSPGFAASLQRLAPNLDYDARFAESIKGRNVVLGAYLSNEKGAAKSGRLSAPPTPASGFPELGVNWYQWYSHGGNLPDLAGAAASTGIFNSVADSDGVFRRTPAVFKYQGDYYEALSVAVLRSMLNAPPAMPGAFAGGALEQSAGYLKIEWMTINPPGQRPLRVPVDSEANMLIPYRGKGGPEGGTFKYISLADVASGKTPLADLKGKITLVGTSAPGLKDLRSTPVGTTYPGVEIHANLISGMWLQDLKEQPAYVVGAELVLLLLTSAALIFTLPFLSPVTSISLFLIAGLAIIGINYTVYMNGVMLPMASGLLAALVVFITDTAYGYFVESRSKRQFASLFGQYVPPELVNEMARDPTAYSMEPKSANITTLFCDVRGFTSISETLSPRDLALYINEYLSAMSAAISAHNGTLDKYIGDAVMAFWGAPVPMNDHARQGVLAALEMQKTTAILREQFRARGWPELKIGIGLNTGDVRVGDMGSKVRKAYTVMGDAVNLASRLEGRTKGYGVGILVGQATARLVDDVVFKELDRVRVKGKSEPVTIYEPLAQPGELSEAQNLELAQWQLCLVAYREQRWADARDCLTKLQVMAPGAYLYELYAGRIQALVNTPPGADWDGVTNFEDK